MLSTDCLVPAAALCAACSLSAPVAHLRVVEHPLHLQNGYSTFERTDTLQFTTSLSYKSPFTRPNTCANYLASVFHQTKAVLTEVPTWAVKQFWGIHTSTNVRRGEPAIALFQRFKENVSEDFFDETDTNAHFSYPVVRIHFAPLFALR